MPSVDRILEISMEDAMDMPGRRVSRFWLFAPVTLLVLVAIAWTIAWFVIRNRTVEGLNAWIAAEAGAGRVWSCRDRSVGGYPFNIEVSCASLDLKQGAITANLGAFHSAAQVYQPRFVITEIAGPLQFSDGTTSVRGTWDLLQTSIHGSADGLQRASLVADNPQFTITGLASGDVSTSSRRFEAHLRPNPSRRDEQAFDAAITARQARIPAIDALIPGSEATDVQIDATATQAEGFRGRPVAAELERWRNAGGKLDLAMFSLTKGQNKLEAKGVFSLDDLHRPTGQVSIASAGLDALIGSLTGGRIGGNLLGALFGSRPAPGAPAGQPRLVPLPPLTLANGKVAMGPFVVPNLLLPPLY
jgi:hypothetical protein